MVRKRKDHRLLYEMIGASTIVFEVIDARFPLISRSKKIETYAKQANTNLVILLNKADLVPKNIVEAWKRQFDAEYPTLYLSATDHVGTSWVRNIIKELVNRSAQADSPLLRDNQLAKICFVGIPNTGKSSIINALKGRKSASTSPKAGHTHGIQFVKLSEGIMLLDSPGVAPVEEMDEKICLMIGAINPEQISDPDVPAMEIIELIEKDFPNSLEKYCGIPFTGNSEEFLENYSKKRFGKIRMDEIGRVIIRDLQQGKIQYYDRPATN